MTSREISPLVPEQTAHDGRAELWMALALGTVHIRFAPIAKIVDEEGDPKTIIPGKTIEFPPCRSNEERMKNELMSTEQNAFCSDSQSFIPIVTNEISSKEP